MHKKKDGDWRDMNEWILRCRWASLLIPLRINGRITDCGEWGCVPEKNIQIFQDVIYRRRQNQQLASSSRMNLSLCLLLIVAMPIFLLFFGEKKEQKERPKRRLQFCACICALWARIWIASIPRSERILFWLLKNRTLSQAENKY